MWLAIVAIASVVQALLFVGAAIGMFAIYRRTVESYERVIESLERMGERHLGPIATKLGHMVDDIDDITSRARRVDDDLRGGVENANRIVWSMATKAWPVLGAARAVRAGLQVLSRRGSNDEKTQWSTSDEISRPSSNTSFSDFERRKQNVS